MSTRTFARAVLVGAGALALLGPLTAATAVAASDTDGGGARIMAAPYAVVPYETVNVRSGPARSYDRVGSVAAGREGRRVRRRRKSVAAALPSPGP